MTLVQKNEKLKSFTFCVLWKVAPVSETLLVQQERKEVKKKKKKPQINKKHLV